MYPNRLKEKLRSGETVLGTSLPAAIPSVVASVTNTSPDFIWIDTEHQPWGTEALEIIPAMMRQKGVAPMIRVAWNDPGLIKKAYDVGAVAVMVPQVDTPEAAEKVVSYSKYPPEGQRGISPNWPLLAGEDFNHIVKTANEETVVIIQLESQQAYDNLDSIKQVEGIDVILVGPMDLSASVGTITEMSSKEVQDIMKDVPRRLEGSGIAAGTTLGDLAEIKEKLGWGYRFMNVGSPLTYGEEVLSGHFQALRSI